MNEVPGQLPMDRHAALNEILLEHLRRIDPHSRPGSDGLTLDVVLESYTQAAAAGQVPGKTELLSHYPELAAELDALFATAEPPHQFSAVVGSPLYFEHTD